MGLAAHNVVLEEQLDQVTQDSQDLRAKVASKEEIIQAQVSEIQELSLRRKSVTLITASTNTEEEKIEESVPLESGGSAYNDSELLQYINELHEQLKSKDDHIETIKEEMRCSSSRTIRLKSLEQFSAKSIDQEIDMATNETSSTKTESKTEDSVDSAKNQTKVTFEKNLVSQENRTRIAFLEMQQAELETEIRLLKQNENVPPKLVNSCDKILVADPFPEKLPEKRTSSGLGDSSIDSSNPELDALSKMVVDKVLEKIKNSSDGGLNRGQKQGQNNSAAAIPTTAAAPPNCDDKNEKAVTQMRHLLQRERNLVSELQAAIQTERLKALEWMERHNREKENLRDLQIEIVDTRNEMEAMNEQHLKDREENQQLTNLYKAEQSQANILETALANGFGQ
jgi:hypothetical protein